MKPRLPKARPLPPPPPDRGAPGQEAGFSPPSIYTGGFLPIYTGGFL